LPNIDARRRYLKYHDLHHLITGYSVGRIGEGEVSAWELGTGSTFVSPVLGMMNVIALSTGLFLEPRRMWRAFQLGCASRNLYPVQWRARVDDGAWPDLAKLRAATLGTRASDGGSALRIAEFACYCVTAMLFHAAIAGPALIARVVTDLGLGYSVFQVVKPKKRLDLY
jgi:hypothetical protein